MSDPLLSESYRIRDKRWRISTLIAASRDLEPFDLPIHLVDRSYDPFSAEDFAEWIEHYERVQKADLEKPVILSSCGVLMDGRHRVVRAMIEGRNTVKAVQFEKMPSPDGEA